MDNTVSADTLRGRLRAAGYKVNCAVGGGAVHVLTKAEMQVICDKLSAHSSSIAMHPLTNTIPSRLVHMFWSSRDHTKWNDVFPLGSENQPGLKAALVHGCEVWLWTYHPGVGGASAVGLDNVRQTGRLTHLQIC